MAIKRDVPDEDNKLEKAIEVVQKAGGHVRFPVRHVKKTFAVEEPLLKEFMASVKDEGIRVKDGLQAALRMYLDARRTKKK